MFELQLPSYNISAFQVVVKYFSGPEQCILGALRVWIHETPPHDTNTRLHGP